MTPIEIDNECAMLKVNIDRVVKTNSMLDLEQQYEIAKKRLNTIFVERYNDFVRTSEWE